MLVIFILGLFLSSPQEVKQQTQKHLMAMQRMTAIETVDNRSHTVAYYDNQQVGVEPLFKHGVGVQSAWWVLLRDSQVWRWNRDGNSSSNVNDSGNRGGGNSFLAFSYRDACSWSEQGRIEQAPCDGTIEVEGLDVTRITQRLHTRKWGVVTLDLKYDWVELSERRLVPQSLTLGWRDKTITATWSGYQEFRGTEPKVSEAEADDDETTIEEGTTATPSVNDQRALASRLAPSNSGRSDPLAAFTGDNSNAVPALLTLPDGVWKEVKVKRSWWKRLLIVKVKK